MVENGRRQQPGNEEELLSKANTGQVEPNTWEHLRDHSVRDGMTGTRVWDTGMRKGGRVFNWLK